MSDFVHLHTHTEYSLLDGAAKISKLVAAAKRKGMKALAITDHGVMYGIIDFYKECIKQGIKPILGCEVYVAPNSRFERRPQIDDKFNHLVLLAENMEGYLNLLKIVSSACVDGFYYKPRVDKALLKEYHHGIIALSACLAGEIPQLILNRRYEEAKKTALEYRDIFGENNFFLELQDHNLREQKEVNQHLIILSKNENIPLVATNDVHYVEKEQSDVQDVLLCIQTSKTIHDEGRMRFSTNEFYLKDYAEMLALFPHQAEALENTAKIAERCKLELNFGGYHLPNYEVPAGHTIDTYLEELCNKGIREKYPEVDANILGRLNYELGIIKQMGFSGYFLIVWDMIHFARQKGIFVGPGRGSAAGSIVAYVLGITTIDPIKYDLLFERFLNPERITMPDIDTDFCFERRGEIIEYLTSKYGNDHVAQIITFGTMAAKGAIRDVGRALDVSLAEVDKLAKMVPNELGITLDKALDVSADLQSIYREKEHLRKLIDTARDLEGTPRHASTHAAGVVIAKEKLVDYVPLQRANEGTVVTQFPMQTIEEIGLLKMDVLGLRTLTVIGKALEIIEKTTGKQIDINNIPMNDVNSYNLLAGGETLGVFQLESSGMRAIMRNLKPERFEDIVALVALYRPGPLGSGMVEDFIARKHGLVEASYLHPKLEPILKDSYGVILYQEQVMKIASELAGFSLGQADLLRRAMGKKKPEIIAAQKQNFIEGSLKNNIEFEVADKVFDLMAYFAGYGFNKSHSAAYALISYQTAYLKANFPVEYMTALLTSVMGNPDKVTVYIEECSRLKIDVLPPDVNESYENFTATKGKIRFGLAAVKNVGLGAIAAIIEGRSEGEFTSLEDFCKRVDLHQVNKRVLESLVKSGAFDSLGKYRSRLFNMLDSAVEYGINIQKDKESGQISLFDLYNDEQTKFKLEEPNIPEYPKRDILNMEKELLGFYISGHPLESYKMLCDSMVTHKISHLNELSDGTLIIIAGIINDYKRMITKKGQEMCTFTLEDTTGSTSILVFPKTFLHYNSLIGNDIIILLKGRMSVNDDERKVFAEKISILPEKPEFKSIQIRVREQKFLPRIKEIIETNKGKIPVELCFPTKKTLKLGQNFEVSADSSFKEKIEKICGKGSIKYVF